MRLTLLIGPSETAAARFRQLLLGNADTLLRQGIYAPKWNHLRLYVACAEADEICLTRHQYGFDSPLMQSTFASDLAALITKELAEVRVDQVVLSAAELGNLLSTPRELARLKALFAPHFDDIQIVAHVAEQARALAQHFSHAVTEGRRCSLTQEIELAAQEHWWQGALALRGKNQPHFGLFNDIQQPPFWLDYTALLALWEDTFGSGNVTLRPLVNGQPGTGNEAEELAHVLGYFADLKPVKFDAVPAPIAAATLTRMHQFNDVLIKFMQVRDIICPRNLWQQMLGSLAVDGASLEPGSLSMISDHFQHANAGLIGKFPDLRNALTPDPPQEPWSETSPRFGFRATQYLAAYQHRITAHATSLAEKHTEEAQAQATEAKFDDLLMNSAATGAEKAANSYLRDRVKVNHQMVKDSPFSPHNNLGSVNEEELAPAYAAAPARELASGHTGNVIVACMKNEAPYLVEWLAYHRAIGVDNFLIHTNDCADGTDQMLGRLQDMGILQHRNNDKWRGNSPQQHALNQALKEPVIQNADWIIHIDVDEFINVRTGNGTLQDLLAAVPDATNIAMTWRLFGHNGVTSLSDDFVIDQFDTCAPKHCPKPHTVWGFKTMFRNIGAYSKMSCHRPNKLEKSFENKVKWVNGSGQDMTREAARNGWRSTKRTIGYDLVQLNHYPLRSAEGFLIKRHRGRALHVDRSIGINYWVRMDWSYFRDVTIKRNLPRMRAEYAALMSDKTLKDLHQQGLDWHRAKARELHAEPETNALYQRALEVQLTPLERVAYALALDMET